MQEELRSVEVELHAVAAMNACTLQPSAPSQPAAAPTNQPAGSCHKPNVSSRTHLNPQAPPPSRAGLRPQAAPAQSPAPGQRPNNSWSGQKEHFEGGLPFRQRQRNVQSCCAQQARPLVGRQHRQGQGALAGQPVLTAWGKRVTSVRRMGREGSRYHLHTRHKGYSNFLARLHNHTHAGILWVTHRTRRQTCPERRASPTTRLPAEAVVGPSSGFSLIMHTLVSRLQWSTCGDTCGCTFSGVLQWKVAGRAATLRWRSMGAPTASQNTTNLPVTHAVHAHPMRTVWSTGNLQGGALCTANSCQTANQPPSVQLPPT